MADNFIFEIGGNIDAFKKTISEVEAELKRVRGTLKNQLGQGLVDANKNIAQLEQSLINLKQVGLDKLPKAANNGSAALFSLSQVARDAPFGFIAIQNNLPLVVDQFSALSKTSGGLVGALKNVGLALIGPAGISFAFGAIIAGVTTLVQKYGSLGNAIDVIFQRNGKLTGEILKAKESYKEYSKELKTTTELAGEEAASTSGQIAKIQALSKIVLDQNLSYEKRNSALNTLKEINKDHFGDLSIEKTKFDDLKGAVDGYTASLIASAKTKGFEQEISRTSVELFKQEQLLNKLKTALEEARRAPVVIRGKEGLIDTSKVDAATSAYNAQNAVVKQLKQEQTTLNAELQKSVDVENSLKVVVDARIEQAKKEADAKKKLEEANKKATAAQIKADKEATESNRKRFERFIQYLKDLQIEERKLAAEQARASFAGLDFAQAVRKQGEQATKDQKNLNAWYAILDQIGAKNFDVSMSADGLTQSLKGVSNILKPTIDNIKQVKWETAFNLIYDNLINPLEYLFDSVLEKGKFSWKEFGNIVLEQLKRIIVQIAATTAAAALANIIVPGAGTLAVGVANAAQRGTANIGGGGVSVGRPSAVNFGGIQGGLGLSGQVVFVQRGTDLVGVLNRSNATINRVG
jgi:hypothetical protein